MTCVINWLVSKLKGDWLVEVIKKLWSHDWCKKCWRLQININVMIIILINYYVIYAPWNVFYVEKTIRHKEKQIQNDTMSNSFSDWSLYNFLNNLQLFSYYFFIKKIILNVFY